MESELPISCLCVTENRSQFMPWLLWCYDRQTWKRKELVIVDSSLEPFETSRPDVRVVRARPGTGILEKRRKAMQEMRGDALAWFDDDDWQHPERLERIARALKAGAGMAGVGHTWLLDLFSGACRRHVEPKGALLFNATGYTRELVRSGEALLAADGIGAETAWSYGLQRRPGTRVVLLSGPPLTALLCHSANVANVPSRWFLDLPLEAFRSEVGERGWQDTSEQLDALRERLRTSPLVCQREAAASGPRGSARARRDYHPSWRRAGRRRP